MRLSLVFGNEAKDGVCPFYRRDECSHRDIGAGEEKAATADSHAQRWNYFAHHYRRELPQVNHLVLYNSGLCSIPKRCRRWRSVRSATKRLLPSLRMLSLDTRELFVQRDRLSAPRSRLPAQVSLRIILGLESADEEVV